MNVANDNAPIVLHHGDCIEGMRSLADGSIDVTITDPPYEAEAHTKQARRREPGAGKGAAQFRPTVIAPLAFAPITELQRAAAACEIARLTKRWALVFCQVEASHKWADALRAAGLDYVRTMVWIKPDGQRQFTGDRPGMGYESIVVAHPRGRKRWNGGGRVGVFTFNKFEAANKNGAPHPTTKPQALMRELVELFTDPGELVCDPFAGSGSTGIACRMLGRRFVGWELDLGTFEIAQRRLTGDEAKPSEQQLRMFGGS